MSARDWDLACPAGVASLQQWVDARQSAVGAAGHFRYGTGRLSGVPDTFGRAAASGASFGVVLQEAVAGLAAAGGV
jgi:hypothetical protein